MTSEVSSILGIERPIIQGPFGGGLSTVELVSTVSNHGALGSFGAHYLDGAGIQRLASDLRAATSKPFALNLWVEDHDPGGNVMTDDAFESAWQIYAPYFTELNLAKPAKPAHYHPRFDDQIDALLAARPAAFSFVFGIPSAKIIAECRRLQIATIGAVTTLAEAEAMYRAGIDILLVSGFEAGGHRPSFLKRAEDSLMGTLALTRLVQSKINRPIIAAGGLSDAQSVTAILQAGADAAQLGTAFLACQESGASTLHKDILFSSRSTETVLTRSYSGRLARGIPNYIIREFHDRAAELPPFPIHSWFVGKLKSASIAGGDEDFVSLYAGQGAPLLKHKTVTELLDSLV